MQKISNDNIKGEREIPQVVIDTVLAWLNTEQKQGSLTEYFDRISLAGPSMSPENVLAESLIASLRSEGKTKKKGFVKRQLNELKPVCLGLGKMALHTNQMILEKSRERYLELSLLAERINLHFVSRKASQDMKQIGADFSSLPYPVESSLKDLHNYFSREHIICWRELTLINNWVKEYLISQGHKTLPYPGKPDLIRKRAAHMIAKKDEDIKEFSSLFNSEQDMRLFIEHKNFSYGLTDVPDDVFEKLVENLKNELNDLSTEGEFEQGKTLIVNENILPFLRSIPVINGEWIDLEITLYLEATAILSENNYLFSSSDIHPFAFPAQLQKGPSGNDKGEDNIAENTLEIFRDALSQAEKELKRYPWKSCLIRGREHIPLDSYLAMERKHWKGSYEISDGLKIDSWNRWVKDEAKEEEVALINNVQVHSIDLQQIIGQVYETSPEEVEKNNRITNTNTEIMRKWKMHDIRSGTADNDRNCSDRHYSTPYITDTEPIRIRLSEIRIMAENIAIDLLGMRTAVNWLSQKFFQDHNILFPEIEKDIDHSIDSIHKLIETYNHQIASEIEIYGFSDHPYEEQNKENNWTELFPRGYYISLETIRDGVLSRGKQIFYDLSFFLS